MRQRNRNKIFNPTLEQLDSGELFIRRHGLVFLKRALEFLPRLSEELLQYFFNCLGFERSLDMLTGVSFQNGKITHTPFSEFREEYHDGTIENIRDLVSESMKGFRRRNRSMVEHFIAFSISAIDDYLKEHEEALAGNEFDERLRIVEKNLALMPVETELLRFLVVIENLESARQYFNDHLDLFSSLRRKMLSAVLQGHEHEIKDALKGTLFKMGFCYSNGSSCHQSDMPTLLGDFTDYWESSGDVSQQDRFHQALSPQLDLDDHFIDGETLNMLRAMLSQKSENPTHILFYGPPGVGKTQLARSLVQAVGAKAYEVLPEKFEDGSGQKGNLAIAYSCTCQGEGAILIVDEADGLLSPWHGQKGGKGIFSSYNIQSSKPWLDYFLELPNARCIWIVNNADGIDPAVMRRFSYSLHFPRLGKREREKIWRRAGQDLIDQGSEMLTIESIRYLAESYAVSAGVINQALKKSLEACPDSEKILLRYLEKNIEAYLELSGQPADQLKINTEYRLTAITANPAPSALISQLSAWRDWNKTRNLRDRKGLSLIFHGLPGTGKSELARYLARHLDMELMHRRASDILSPWVGVSERIVAETFREAEAKGAILLIDEVESFFFNRDQARRSWELSLVNEFLTRLESFRGLFIGSTNRFGDLDSAALRRFSFKVEFQPMSLSGKLELFQAMLTPISNTPLTAGEQQLLDSLGPLTPGDFKVASERFCWSASGTINNLELIEALKEESALRSVCKDSPQQPQAVIN